MEYNFKTKQAIMKELVDKGRMFNGTIATEDGGLFNVHLEFLAGMSPFLESIIVTAKDTPFESVMVPGVSKQVIENIINFLYTGHLNLSMNTVSDVAKAGAMLGMPHIIKLCRKYILSHLDNENCLRVYLSQEFAPIHGMKDEVKPYILHHFQQIYPISSDFLNMDINDLVCILSSDNLNVSGENEIFWAILRWVEHDPNSRLKYFPNLLRCIRLGLCDPRFYEHHIQDHPHIRNSEECQDIILQASQMFADMPPNANGQRSNMLLDKRHPFLRPRTPNEIIFVMGGWSAGSATNVIETFDVKSGRWFLSLDADNIPRAYHGMLWHKGYIYVIGGFDGNQCFNDVKRFDPVSHVWEEKACMYQQRCYVSVAALDGYIYAMGGYDGHRRNRTCERYDSELNQWKLMANMNQVRSDASADTLNGKIYIAGGFNGVAVLNSAECYDPQTNTWTDIRNMNSPRSGVKLAAFNDYLFIIGGFDGNMRLPTVERYDPRSKTWTPVSNMNGPRSNFAVAVMYDCLYVIGGFNGLATISLGECYHHQKNIWVPITELNLNRSALAACTVKDIQNAAEYTFLGNAPYM